MEHGVEESIYLRPEFRRRPPALLRFSAIGIAVAVLLPLIYLLIRAGESGPRVLDIATRPETMRVFWNSVILTLLVTGTSSIIGVTLAWLTTRTDLPGRSFWAIATSLPLVLPSYVGAFALLGAIGPGGMLANLLAHG
jgi:iron(III) transport system permease protein